MFWGAVEESEKVGSHWESNPGHLTCAVSTLLLYLPQPDNHQPSHWVAARAFQSHLCSMAAQARCSGFNSGPFFFPMWGKMVYTNRARTILRLWGHCSSLACFQAIVIVQFSDYATPNGKDWSWAFFFFGTEQYMFCLSCSTFYHSKLQLLICLYFCCITFILQLPHQSLNWLCERLRLLHCKSPGDLPRCSMDYLHTTS